MNKIIQEKQNSTFCFIDVETECLTLHECKNRPWQISMIILNNNRIIREHDFYVKWEEPLDVSKGAAIATRFDPSIIESKGLPPEVILKTVDFELSNCDYVVGHNILGFDAYIIMGFYRKVGATPFNIYPKAIDTFSLAKAWKTEQLPKQNENIVAWQLRMYHKRVKGLKCSLGALGKEFDIEHDYDSLHSAINDLRLNVKVFGKLKNIYSS